ncbi:MAG: hypothetical protein M3132_11735 [Actinomycetia bacterium]|nr:hypothetical protein [Actinomycetes bacterium]
MSESSDVAGRLAEIQKKLLALPDDAFAEKYALHREQDALKEEASEMAEVVDFQRTDDDLLRELYELRRQAKLIEGQRVNLTVQAGGADMSGVIGMGLAGDFAINKGIERALPGIRSRIGLIKGTFIDRGVDFPPVP